MINIEVTIPVWSGKSMTFKASADSKMAILNLIAFLKFAIISLLCVWTLVNLTAQYIHAVTM